MLQHDERVLLSADDRAAGLELLQRAFPGPSIAVDEGRTPFSVRFAASAPGPLRVSELRMRGTATMSGTTLPGSIVAGLLLAGRLDADYARHRLDTSRPFLRPGGAAEVRMTDVHLRLVQFDADRFRVESERFVGPDGRRLRLLRTRPVDEAAGEAWRWAAGWLHDALLGAVAPSALLQDELFALGTHVLLSAFGEPVGDAHDPRTVPTAVRRAVAYLEEHAAGQVTVPEVAAAARVSPRSLQALFRRHLGVTPLAHLHAIRLDAARRDLLNGAVASATVHEVALRWGFGNSGRFARLYAERFGERPSETLRLS